MKSVMKTCIDSKAALAVSAASTAKSVAVNRANAQVCQIVGTVESVLTRRLAEGSHHFLQLKAAEGQLVRAKWLAQSDGALPNLGEVLRIEVEIAINGKVSVDPSPSRTAVNEATPAIQDKSCHSIRRCQVIHTPYALSVLQDLYQAAECPGVLDRLWSLFHRVPVPLLRDWLFDLFAQPAFSVPFVNVPASYHHHHNDAGGLLLHSVECGEWVAQVAQHSLNDKEAALAIAAALLHDAGKIQTMQGGAGVTPSVAHEVLTLTLLEPALRQLQATWPQGANGLRQMLSWSNHYEKFPRLPGTLLVKMADQYSTSLSARRQAFKASPPHFYWAKLQTATGVQMFERVN